MQDDPWYYSRTWILPIVYSGKNYLRNFMLYSIIYSKCSLTANTYILKDIYTAVMSKNLEEVLKYISNEWRTNNNKPQQEFQRLCNY